MQRQRDESAKGVERGLAPAPRLPHVDEMPRRLRHQEPAAYYHIVSRGNNKQVIFDEQLRVIFLRSLLYVSVVHEWRVLAWALMDNHFHLVLRIGDGGLSRGMWQLNNGFARAANTRFDRINHCFGRRFWSGHLDTHEYLLASIRYAMWNPPRAAVCREPAESRWTSFRGSIGLEDPHPVLASEDLLSLFGADSRDARRALFEYVQKGRVRCQAPWDGPPST
jgi:putative transposase